MAEFAIVKQIMEYWNRFLTNPTALGLQKNRTEITSHVKFTF